MAQRYQTGGPIESPPLTTSSQPGTFNMIPQQRMGGSAGGPGGVIRTSQPRTVARQTSSTTRFVDATRLNKRIRSRHFAVELPTLMFGAGDSDHPYEQTVDVVEDFAIQFIKNIMERVRPLSERRGRLNVDDLLHVIRDDRKKFLRAKELLALDKDIKALRNAEKKVGEQMAKDEAPAPPPPPQPQLLPPPASAAPGQSSVPASGQSRVPTGPPVKRRRGRPRKSEYINGVLQR